MQRPATFMQQSVAIVLATAHWLFRTQQHHVTMHTGWTVAEEQRSFLFGLLFSLLSAPRIGLVYRSSRRRLV
jgi:hypothetical protein